MLPHMLVETSPQICNTLPTLAADEEDSEIRQKINITYHNDQGQQLTTKCVIFLTVGFHGTSLLGHRHNALIN